MTRIATRLGLAGALLTLTLPLAAQNAAKSAGVEFRPATMDLAPGETYLTELFVPSPTGKAAKVKLSYSAAEGLTVLPDERWTGNLSRFGAKSYPKVRASREAEGELTAKATVEPGSVGELKVRIVRPAVEVIPERDKLRVKLTNPFRTRLLHGRVQAANPNRFLQNITAREFKIPAGQSGEVVFPLPGASPVEGEIYDFTLTVQTYQGYQEKRVFHVTFPPQPERRPF